MDLKTNPTRVRTLREMAQMALAVQDACNLSSVVHSFSEVMADLGRHPECTGTDWKNRHPIAVMFASKIASLTGCENVGNFSIAYQRCCGLVES